MKPVQLDLFAWADNRPSAQIIDAIPAIVRRIWRERNQQTHQHAGQVITLPRPMPERKTA